LFHNSITLKINRGLFYHLDHKNVAYLISVSLKHVAATGMSRGKVAGIYAFRLSRASIIHFCPGKVQTRHKHDKTVNAAIALKTAFDAIKLPLKEIKPAVLRELICNLRKWHM
jgi:hypothetical protein